MGDHGKLPPPNGSMRITDFENMSFEDMLNMIRGVDPMALMGRGNALIDAHAEIEKIGNELKEHVSRTKWKGNGGDAFREWGDDFAKQTLKLADYAGAAGASLRTAGQALIEVSTVLNSHPQATSEPIPNAAAEMIRLRAVEEARNEAIPQMNKLASYYMTAQQMIATQEEPLFKPLPASTLPEVPVDAWKDRYGSEEGSDTPPISGAPSTSGPGHQPVTAQPVDGATSPVTSVSDRTPHTVTTPQAVGATPGTTPGAPDTTGTGIDTVTLPQAPPTMASPPNGGPPPQPPVSGGGGPTAIPPVALPPQAGGVRRIAPVAPAPVGRGGVEGVRPPAAPRADPAIHGGMPARSVTGPVAGGPRGTVIGGEGPVTGRGMLGGHGAGPVGSPMGRGVGAGASRRLVTEPGGMVGSPRGAGAAREFTPGGSGLVRGSGMGAMGPMGSTQNARRRPGRRDGESPDYLTEDEGTWDTGDGVVPPVID